MSVFVTDVSVMDAASALVEEGWRRGAVVQVVATDERFDASALKWATSDSLGTGAPS